MAEPSGPLSGKVCVGQFAGSHGVRGLVKLRSFTADPADVASYGALSDEQGRRRFALALVGTAKDLFLARVDGVGDRDAAQALSGVRLFVDRAALPAPEDEEEFYHADLIGLRAERVDGTPFGRIKAVHDFGAGDVLEIQTAGGASEMLPFSRAVVPVVDVRGGRVVIDPPIEVEARPEKDEQEDEGLEGEAREPAP